jgi:hypothetical protein
VGHANYPKNERGWLFTNFCFNYQLALVDDVGTEHPLVLGDNEQLTSCGCNFSGFSLGSSNS